MKPIALFLITVSVFAQSNDPDAVAAKVAVDSLAVRLKDKTAESALNATVAKNVQEQLTAALARESALKAESAGKDAVILDLENKLSAIPPAAPMDTVVTWLKSWNDVNGDAQPYSLMKQMSTFPIASYYTPGKIATLTDDAERYTLVCVSNAGIAEVGPQAKLATSNVTAK
jgi:hypothetical protein